MKWGKTQQCHVGMVVVVASARQQCIAHISHRLLYRGHFSKAAAECVRVCAHVYYAKYSVNKISATLFARYIRSTIISLRRFCFADADTNVWIADRASVCLCRVVCSLA